ncbi:MAG TPA: TetR/AcrR family transcriptional regulator [Acetobacteraceae bacterium]|jgi:TetR/AcrR family transcriptional repressor of nem operon|nr:TetR/AcrR family transcriptional regulator [Acetobacteraceae bacterium]
MGRPREFDEEAVMEAAVDCFWTNGYKATSVRDLASRMGITGASLYNAFGDKRALYRRALDRYVEQGLHERVGRLEAELPPLEAIRGFLTEAVERSWRDPEHRGCMLVNAALEAGPRDPELRGAVADDLAFIEAFFRRCASAGQADGTITARQDADSLAKLLVAVLLGIRVRARTAPDRDVLAGTADAALATIDGVPSSA